MAADIIGTEVSNERHGKGARDHGYDDEKEGGGKGKPL